MLQFKHSEIVKDDGALRINDEILSKAFAFAEESKFYVEGDFTGSKSQRLTGPIRIRSNCEMYEPLGGQYKILNEKDGIFLCVHWKEDYTIVFTVDSEAKKQEFIVSFKKYFHFVDGDIHMAGNNILFSASIHTSPESISQLNDALKQHLEGYVLTSGVKNFLFSIDRKNKEIGYQDLFVTEKNLSGFSDAAPSAFSCFRSNKAFLHLTCCNPVVGLRLFEIVLSQNGMAALALVETVPPPAEILWMQLTPSNFACYDEEGWLHLFSITRAGVACELSVDAAVELCEEPVQMNKNTHSNCLVLVEGIHRGANVLVNQVHQPMSASSNMCKVTVMSLANNVTLSMLLDNTFENGLCTHALMDGLLFVFNGNGYAFFDVGDNHKPYGSLFIERDVSFLEGYTTSSGNALINLSSGRRCTLALDIVAIKQTLELSIKSANSLLAYMFTHLYMHHVSHDVPTKQKITEIYDLCRDVDTSMLSMGIFRELMYTMIFSVFQEEEYFQTTVTNELRHIFPCNAIDEVFYSNSIHNSSNISLKLGLFLEFEEMINGFTKVHVDVRSMTTEHDGEESSIGMELLSPGSQKLHAFKSPTFSRKKKKIEKKIPFFGYNLPQNPEGKCNFVDYRMSAVQTKDIQALNVEENVGIFGKFRNFFSRSASLEDKFLFNQTVIRNPRVIQNTKRIDIVIDAIKKANETMRNPVLSEITSDEYLIIGNGFQFSITKALKFFISLEEEDVFLLENLFVFINEIGFMSSFKRDIQFLGTYIDSALNTLSPKALFDNIHLGLFPTFPKWILDLWCAPNELMKSTVHGGSVRSILMKSMGSEAASTPLAYSGCPLADDIGFFGYNISGIDHLTKTIIATDDSMQSLLEYFNSYAKEKIFGRHVEVSENIYLCRVLLAKLVHSAYERLPLLPANNESRHSEKLEQTRVFEIFDAALKSNNLSVRSDTAMNNFSAFVVGKKRKIYPDSDTNIKPISIAGELSTYFFKRWKLNVESDFHVVM
ncbi:hypothetical protein PCE1_002562 [Barthelona sp. PCE]